MQNDLCGTEGAEALVSPSLSFAAGIAKVEEGVWWLMSTLITSPTTRYLSSRYWVECSTSMTVGDISIERRLVTSYQR